MTESDYYTGPTFKRVFLFLHTYDYKNSSFYAPHCWIRLEGSDGHIYRKAFGNLWFKGEKQNKK